MLFEYPLPPVISTEQPEALAIVKRVPRARKTADGVSWRTDTPSRDRLPAERIVNPGGRQSC